MHAHQLRRVLLPTLLAVVLAGGGGPCAQGWSYGPPVPTAASAPRAKATLVVASAGTYLVGGEPADVNGDAPVHELSGGAWAGTTPLEGLFLHGGAIVDELGRVLVIAGVDASGAMGDSYEWDAANGNNGGIQDRSGQAPEQGFALASDDLGRVLSIGGSSFAAFAVAEPGGRVERYDAGADAWTALAPMPTPVADAAACNDGQGHVLVFGGYDASGARTANVARLDLATGTWSDNAVPDLPFAVAGAEAVLGADGRVYVLGGSASAGPVATVSVLDPVAGTWSAGPAMLEAREHFGCAVDAAGYVWAVGGDASNTSEVLFTSTCPSIVATTANDPVYVGTVASLHVDVAGSPPFTYSWRADGVSLVDGPTGNGSTISGAGAATLTIRAVALADGAHVYDCVVGNGCGTVTTAGIALNMVDPPPLPPAFLVESLHPAGALASTANSIDGDAIVGERSYSHPQYGTLGRPTLWTGGGAGPIVDLTPSGSVGGACARIRGGAIVGWWWWPYTVPQGTGYYRHASLWTLAGVHHEMQIPGWELGAIADTDGSQHAGGARFDETSTTGHAFAWSGTSIAGTNLTPTGAWGSGAAAVDGGRQFGSVNLGYGVVHAAAWSATAASFVDLHPAGASRSYVYAAGGGLQVGAFYNGNTASACLWAGTPESVTELDVPNATVSVAAVRDGLMLGSIAQGGAARPAIFRHGVAEWLELQQFVPPWYEAAIARDLWVDPASGAITVVGSGHNTTTGRTEALVWRAGTVAATATRLGRPCPVTLEFTPDGQGGYGVVRTSPIWFDDSAVGAELAAGGLLPADTMSAAQGLGFAFPMPGGQVTSQVFIDDNGRVVADSAASSSNTPSPGVMRLGPAVIAPYWTDLDSAGGSVRFHADPVAGFATITWRDVPQAGAGNALSFQLRLRDDGSFAITFADVTDWRQPSGTITDDVVVGCSGGNGVADPGAVDFAVYPIASAGSSMVYQRWRGDDAPAHVDLQAHVHPTRQAFVGGAFECELGGVTSATLLSFLIVGLQDPALDVTGLLTGMPGLTGCVLHAAPDALLPMTIAGGAATGALSVPANPAIAGFQVWTQTVQLAPGESRQHLVLSDAFALTVGG